LPNQYETEIASEGSNLSQGQKQLVSIFDVASSRINISASAKIARAIARSCFCP
jgi:ABC-type multidrug transport system fused ATPase/permease subunit